VFTQAFRQVHKELRTDDRKWHEIRKKTGIKLDHRLDHNVNRDLDRQSRESCPSTTPSGEPVAENSYFLDMVRMKRETHGKLNILLNDSDDYILCSTVTPQNSLPHDPRR